MRKHRKNVQGTSDAKTPKHRKTLEHVLTFWLVAYPFGVFLGLVFQIMRLVRQARVKNYSRLSKLSRKTGLLVVCNHPSLYEPVMLYPLFLWHFLRHPIRGAPWSTPDQKNYVDKWPWRIFRSRFIAVPRGNGRGELRSVVEVLKILRAGGIVIMFPEGGRTGKGNDDGFVYSQKRKKRLRRLKSGIGRLVNRASFTVQPVWVDGAEKILPIGTVLPRLWYQMRIKVGEPFDVHRINHPSPQDYEQGRAMVEQALLDLADEGE